MSFFTEKDWSSQTLRSFDNVALFIRVHLKKVYHTLCCALLISAFGIYLHVLWNIGGIITTLGFIGSMGWLFSMAPWKERTRVDLLMFAALCSGASIGHLLELVMIAPSKVITAYLGTAMAFCCFAEAITTSQDRVYVYVLGVLSSNLSILIGLLLASTFFGMCLYFELLLWYMVLDSQAIIVQARHGDVYCVHHALTFFTDLPALLIGLIRNIRGNNVQQPPAEEQRRRRRRSGRRSSVLSLFSSMLSLCYLFDELLPETVLEKIC
ncbi:hypothetical protein ACSBR1_017372 [Camellia fascicularis]